MRPEGIAAADREMKRAARAAQRLVTAKTPDDAEDAWTDFLTHANRVHLKLRGACFGHPLDWSWWKKKMDERRDDPLLAYVHHARNSDTHRLEETTQRMPAGKHVIDVPGMGKVHYNGPQHLRPLPVTDKGIIYPVPTEFRGIKTGYSDAGNIAWFAGMYLQDLVAEAASRLR